MPGETGPIIDKISLPIAMLIGGFFAIAIYNSIEIYISIFRRFPRRRGLYFWSMVCANTGIPVLSIFSLLRYFNITAPGPTSVPVDIGWWLMVTGQSFVLYSRLHLVVGDSRKLRWLLCMIFAVCLFIQLPSSVLFTVISFGSATKSRTITAFTSVETAQLVTVSLQESILSGVYVYACSSTLKTMEIIKGPKVRRMLYELIGLFIVVAALDISLIAVQFAGYFHIQTTYKPVVYSIKLKLEAFVLGNLVNLIIRPSCGCQNGSGSGSNRWALNTTMGGSRRPHPGPLADGTDNTDRHERSPSAESGFLSMISTGESETVQIPMKVLKL
ncbi:putative integral membrane protein [Rosellinia necatrix]|uniref:Putative integral membrane protein n=1 Tax=Rosellinia necatrix TaxID=77044 RepID=A0A1S7UL62_ROSNE|nr:putative integral membrane protein [Rosellinia necatrix]